MAAELETPPFALALEYIWKAYFRLRRRKAIGFNGLDRIEWPDIDAFLRRSGLNLVPWEIEIIERIDDVFLSIMSSDKVTDKEAEQAIVDTASNVARRNATVRNRKGS